MFLDMPGPVPHFDPWVSSFASRFARLTKGSIRIAYFYERPDNSTFRYRVHNMIEAIEALWPEASAAYFSLEDAPHLQRVAEAADVLVICRARYSSVVGSLIVQARRRRIPVLFDVDDLVFDTAYVHLIMHTLNQRSDFDAEWDFWFAYIGRMGATLKMCDAAITTNPYLAQQIKAFADIDVAIVPNFINEWQLSYSRRVSEAKRESRFERDEHLHIGYFSGSPTHAKDFDVTASALARILQEHPKVRIRMVGYLEAPVLLQPFHDRLEKHAFRDYVNLQELIGSTEINIAPLQDNRFTNCKSELKFFEAAIVDTATVASPTSTFAQAIQVGHNGWLASAHEWEQTLTAVIEQLETAPDEYIELAERARNDAEARYGWMFQIGAIQAAVMQGQ